MIHLLKERKGKDVVTKCGELAVMDTVTVWWREVTCPACGGVKVVKRKGQHLG